MLKEHINKEYLQECFIYDKTTGNLIWKQRPLRHFKNEKAMKWVNGRFAGMQVGNIKKTSKKSKTQYLSTRVNNIFFAVHRLVWIYHFDLISNSMQIDHIDRNGLNNRIENLRLVTQSINKRNMPLQSSNKTGVNGVNWHKSAKKWQSRITDLNGKRLDLGRFNNFEDAVKVRKDAEKLYGYLK